MPTMKPILLTNTAAVTARLAEVNGRASSHTATPSDLLRDADRLERLLEAFVLRKKERVGAVAIVESGARTPAAYKYHVTRNRCTLVRVRSGWALTFVGKVVAWGSSQPRESLALTQQQADFAKERFAARFAVLPY